MSRQPRRSASDGQAETCQVCIRAVFDLSVWDAVPFDGPVLTAKSLMERFDCV